MLSLQRELYQSLLVVRNRLGDESGYMPYMVANNKTLLEMATALPTTSAALKAGRSPPTGTVA